MTGYELSRNWFDWCFDNPEKISPNHTAIYLFALEHQNRLGGKEKFGFPSQMTMEALGIKKHQTYIKYFNDLIEWGFINLIQKSTNQYSANIISINKSANTKNGKATCKALDKAFIKHVAKQTESNGQSTGQSNSSIDKQVNKEQVNKETINNSPYGDGRLHFLCVEFERANKGKYEPDFYKDFLEYWTAKIQKGAAIGKERWTDEKTFSLAQRLNTSFKLTWQNKNGVLPTPTVSVTPKTAAVLELTEEEKTEMRRLSGLID